MGEVVELSPAIISFSQAFISDPKSSWNLSEYTEPIDVVAFERHHVTLDNRRLYLAQCANVGAIEVRVHPSYMRLTEDQSVRFSFSICFMFKVELDLHLISMALKPVSYEGAVAMRCCLQARDFPIQGSEQLPVVGQRKSTHRFTTDKIVPTVISPENYGEFIQRLLQSDKIFAYLGYGCPLIGGNSEFQIFIKSKLISDFEIRKVEQYISKFPLLRARADNKDDSDFWENDEAADRLLCEREREILEARDEYFMEQQQGTLDESSAPTEQSASAFQDTTSPDFKFEPIVEEFSRLTVGDSAPRMEELYMLHIPSDSGEEDVNVQAYLNEFRNQLYGGPKIVEVWCGGSVYVLCLAEKNTMHPITQLSIGSRIFPVDNESVIDEVDVEDPDGNEVLMLRAADAVVRVSARVTNAASHYLPSRCCGRTKKGLPCKNFVREAFSMCRWHMETKNNSSYL